MMMGTKAAVCILLVSALAVWTLTMILHAFVLQ